MSIMQLDKIHVRGVARLTQREVRAFRYANYRSNSVCQKPIFWHIPKWKVSDLQQLLRK